MLYSVLIAHVCSIVLYERHKIMNLNISVEDLKLSHYYETQKQKLCRELVHRRAILNDPNEWKVPADFIQSELPELVLQSCTETGIVEVRADGGEGKSTAARFLFKNSAGGIMFCNCIISTITRCYWKGVAVTDQPK